MKVREVLLFLALALAVLAEETPPGYFDDLDDDSDDAAGKEKKDDVPTKPYKKPDTNGLHYAETFDGEVFQRWLKSKKEKYNGQWKVDKRKEEALIGDTGLLVPEEARHYGIATKFPAIKGEKGKNFLLQYEARFQDDLSCGGAYMKVFDGSATDPAEFDADTPYVIMFGPDRCGATDKVHFILKHKSPKNGVWTECHFKNPPGVPHDRLTHLYGLVIKPDNSFEVLIDGKVEKSGNLLNDMEPPVNPPKEIDDPSDKKPENWVDDAKIDDPESSKPDDWDESQPMKIKDPEASMPDGWKEDELKQIPDPSAKKPSDWDEDEDGEWEAPVIDNPACSVGCGKWSAPEIDNPTYKGKWYAPRIDNPAYIGQWAPRKIDNPDYFNDEEPYLLPQISALGFDLWTMQGGLLFDNIVIDRDLEKVKSFTEQTFGIRKEIEELQKPKRATSEGFLDTITEFVSNNALPVGVTFIIILVSLVWFCCREGDIPAASPPPAAKKKAKEDAKDAPTNGKAEKEEDKKKEEPEKKKEDGGIGTMDDEDDN